MSISPSPVVEDSDIDEDSQVHHHAKGTFEEALRALDNGWALEALCGAKRPALPNPVAHPCCKACSKLLGGPCSIGM